MEKDNRSRDFVSQDQNTSLEKQAVGNLLETALSKLQPEQVNKLSQVAAEKALNIQEERVRADQRFRNSSRDINEFVDTAARLGQSPASDYKMTGDFESASGKTHVQVSKQGSYVTIAIAVVIGLVLLLLFLSRH